MSEQKRREEGWRAPILRQFTPEIASTARLTIVADPDRLLTEPALLLGLRARGFELVPYDDEIAFRHAYESHYRRVWDRGEATPLVVALQAGRDDVELLPWDLVAQARRDGRLLRFSLADIFPHLAPTVIAELDRTDLDALYEAQRRHEPERLGENMTRDFVLRHLLGVASELIATPADLLRVLLRRHIDNRAWPASLEQRFLHLVRQTQRFDDWPIERLLLDRQTFLAFIQERWPVFLKSCLTKGQLGESPVQPAFAVPGPELLPLDHHDIRGYIVTLFIDGLLEPSTAVSASSVQGTWAEMGVRRDDVEDAVNRLGQLTVSLLEALPGESSSYLAWLTFAQRWAEWTALRWTVPVAIQRRDRETLDDCQRRVDEAFQSWLLESYRPLHTLPPWPRPVMVHHVPHALAHGSAPGSARVALLVVDGLGLSQWLPLRSSLRFSPRALRVREHAIFAWVPTLTAVSRQAIFSGEVPFYFGQSINGTHKEEQHWRRFWEDRGLARERIGYVRQNANEPDDAFKSRVLELAARPPLRALGVVVGRFDEMLHGNVTGAAGLQAQARHWADMGHFEHLVTGLIEHGWKVSVTADHGNIEAVGIGKPNVGATAEARGERAHVFPDSLIRKHVHDKFPTCILWPQVALPENYHVLLAGRRQAFVSAGAQIVCHGGVSLEEVVVPFAEIEES